MDKSQLGNQIIHLFIAYTEIYIFVSQIFSIEGKRIEVFKINIGL